MKKEKNKAVKVHTFLVCTDNSPYVAQTAENFARLHNCETVTFRNSVNRVRSEE